LPLVPEARLPRVPMEHGITTVASSLKDPDAKGEEKSSKG
jgi:hypothetical protein